VRPEALETGTPPDTYYPGFRGLLLRGEGREKKGRRGRKGKRKERSGGGTVPVNSSLKFGL